MADAHAAAGTAEQPKLIGGAVGLAGLLFQSITHMAPAAGIIFSVQYMASQGGASLGLGFILATIACTLTALCLKEVVQKVRSAGGWFVVNMVGLGSTAGFLTSWLYMLYDPINPAGAELLWGAYVSSFLAKYVGINVPWPIFTILMAVVVTYLIYLGVRPSIEATIALGVIELGLMVILGVVLIAKAGPNQPLVSLLPTASPTSWGGVSFAMVFGILAFLGFESVVPLAEESHNPRRTLTIAILVSTIAIGLYYCFGGYFTVAGWAGIHDPNFPNSYIDFSHWDQATDAKKFADDFSGADTPFYTLGARAFGAIGPLIVLLLVSNSLFAVAISCSNSCTRIFYALGRAGAFPRGLGHVNERTRTPDRAIFLMGAISVIAALVFGYGLGVDPLTAFGLLGLLLTVGAIVIYIMANLSVISIYGRLYRDEFNVLNHLIIPILAVLFMLPPLVASLFPRVLDVIGMGFDNQYPVSLGLPITVIWAVIGVGYYLWLRAKRPQALRALATEMERVELVGEEADPRARAIAPTTEL